MRLSIAEIIEATSGETVVAPSDIETAATDLVWDSREAGAGCLYAALPGERVDGHAFVAAAIRSGAVCALVAQDPDPDAADAAREAGAAIVKVSDTQRALVDLARFWRGKLGGRVIGLTGSSGKTTTKNLVRDVLSAGFSVTATSGNQNNELGVPKTVLSASADDGAVVVEMGMRGMGQIEQLCGYVRPEWGIIVNVGTSHMELLGSRENIARAKAELLEALPAGGCAFINGADDYAAFARDHARLRERGVKVVVFDGSPEAAGRMDVLKGARLAEADEQGAAVRRGDGLVWAEDIVLDGEGRATFKLYAANFPPTSETASETESAECALSLRGLHNVGNACAAAAVGRAMGMPLSAIVAALGAAQPESGRAQVLRTAAGVTVVDDSYNANPESMRASLSTFAALGVEGRKIAILGDMGELGELTVPAHEDMGRLCRELGLDRVIAIGPKAASIARTAGEAAEHFDTIADALPALRAAFVPGAAVLVKASHAMEFGKIVKELETL